MQISVFNPKGDDSLLGRKIWDGNPTNLIQLNDVKYTWATSIYDVMLSNFWLPQKVDLSLDGVCYRQVLTPKEQYAYTANVSYLTFLDSIQVKVIPFIAMPCTAPELSLVLGQHCSQEGLHSKSYQVMIEAVIDAEKRAEVYDLWRTIPVLRERCRVIGSIYQEYVNDHFNREKYFQALVADYLLESLYFFGSFYFFYNLNSRGLMNGSGDMIRFINRDENTHIALFKFILAESKNNLPYSQDFIYNIMDEAVNQEIELYNTIFDNEILGITNESTDLFIKYLADNRLKNIGLKPIYNIPENPYKHLEKLSDPDSDCKVNFFESTVTNYQQSNAIAGDWNF